jgi:hypothetical protein
MLDSVFGGGRLLSFSNVVTLSTVVILAFSLLAYTLTYNFRVPVARRFSLLLLCVMLVYASEVAVTRITSPASAENWLRFEWLGIALTPAVYYLFSNAVLATTNFPLGRRRWVAVGMVVLSILAAADALLGRQIVSDVRYTARISYLEAGPLFWPFAAYFALAVVLALGNILHARRRCLTESTRRRMTYLALGFVAPALGVFPYLIAGSRLNANLAPDGWIFVLSFIGNVVVAVMLVVMSYTVAYFGVLTPDRVVRYRMLRFFMRGPVVAILVMLAVLAVPTIERVLGLPRDTVLFSVVTGVIVFSQLFLSVTKSVLDRVIYREDREEIAWLRELDRHLLTTTDLRQFLENHLVALCELLRVRTGFVASLSDYDLLLEAIVGPDLAQFQVTDGADWGDALARTLEQGIERAPLSYGGFWLWPLQERSDDGEVVLTLGILGVEARTAAPLLSQEEQAIAERMVERIAGALVDRRLQQSVFVTLRSIIPDIDRIQRMRTVVPYAGAGSATPTADAVATVAAMLEDSPINSPEFEAWVKDALSHYWGGPKLTQSPLIELGVVNRALEKADDDPTKALRLVLGAALERLKPGGKQNFTAPEWLLYNILELRFIQGRKVREIADRLAMSESDLYRKQRVAIGHLARVLSEMEQETAGSEGDSPAGSNGLTGPNANASAEPAAALSSPGSPGAHAVDPKAQTGR